MTSCTEPSDPDPPTFFDIELDHSGVNEAQFTLGMRAMELGVALHRRRTVWACLGDRDPVEYTATIIE